MLLALVCVWRLFCSAVAVASGDSSTNVATVSISTSQVTSCSPVPLQNRPTDFLVPDSSVTELYILCTGSLTPSADMFAEATFYPESTGSVELLPSSPHLYSNPVLSTSQEHVEITFQPTTELAVSADDFSVHTPRSLQFVATIEQGAASMSTPPVILTSLPLSSPSADESVFPETVMFMGTPTPLVTPPDPGTTTVQGASIFFSESGLSTTQQSLISTPILTVSSAEITATPFSPFSELAQLVSITPSLAITTAPSDRAPSSSYSSLFSEFTLLPFNQESLTTTFTVSLTPSAPSSIFSEVFPQSSTQQPSTPSSANTATFENVDMTSSLSSLNLFSERTQPTATVPSLDITTVFSEHSLFSEFMPPSSIQQSLSTAFTIAVSFAPTPSSSIFSEVNPHSSTQLAQQPPSITPPSVTNTATFEPVDTTSSSHVSSFFSELTTHTLTLLLEQTSTTSLIPTTMMSAGGPQSILPTLMPLAPSSEFIPHSQSPITSSVNTSLPTDTTSTPSTLAHSTPATGPSTVHSTGTSSSPLISSVIRTADPSLAVMTSQSMIVQSESASHPSLTADRVSFSPSITLLLLGTSLPPSPSLLQPTSLPPSPLQTTSLPSSPLQTTSLPPSPSLLQSTSLPPSPLQTTSLSLFPSLLQPISLPPSLLQTTSLSPSPSLLQPTSLTSPPLQTTLLSPSSSLLQVTPLPSSPLQTTSLHPSPSQLFQMTSLPTSLLQTTSLSLSPSLLQPTSLPPFSLQTTSLFPSPSLIQPTSLSSSPLQTTSLFPSPSLIQPTSLSSSPLQTTLLSPLSSLLQVTSLPSSPLQTTSLHPSPSQLFQMTSLPTSLLQATLISLPPSPLQTSIPLSPSQLQPTSLPPSPSQLQPTSLPPSPSQSQVTSIPPSPSLSQPPSLPPSTSQLQVTSLPLSTPLPTPDQIHLVVIRLILLQVVYEQLLSAESARANLEVALADAYRRALLQLAPGRRQTSTATAKVVEVQMRNSDSGATPIVFYITAGDRLVPADVVVVVMENARIREVGGYQVVSLATVGGGNSNMVAVTAGSVTAAVVVLCVLALAGVFLCAAALWRQKKRRDRVDRIDSHDVEYLQPHEDGAGGAVGSELHSIPAIERLARHAVRRKQRLISLPRLSSTGNQQGEAWQSDQLHTGLPRRDAPHEEPAALFEHIAHFAQQQSAAPPHSKMRFHSSVAPSPSTSQNSKVSHSSDQHMKASSSELEPTAVIIKEVDQRSDKVHEVDEEVLERRMATLERLKLQSQQRSGSRKRRKPQPTLPTRPPVPHPSVQGTKGRESEVDAVLGDVEGSSHSDEPVVLAPVSSSRPTTKSVETTAAN